jgi:hypothetical protein
MDVAVVVDESLRNGVTAQRDREGDTVVGQDLHRHAPHLEGGPNAIDVAASPRLAGNRHLRGPPLDPPACPIGRLRTHGSGLVDAIDLYALVGEASVERRPHPRTEDFVDPEWPIGGENEHF